MEKEKSRAAKSRYLRHSLKRNFFTTFSHKIHIYSSRVLPRETFLFRVFPTHQKVPFNGESRTFNFAEKTGFSQLFENDSSSKLRS